MSQTRKGGTEVHLKQLLKDKIPMYLLKILFYLKPSFPDFEFHVVLLRLALIHAVKVLFADLLECI